MSESFSFGGFPRVEQNWHRLPNCWTDILAGISSLAEIKVLHYVLRHTWGFSEYDQPKVISLDEFQHGRRRRDGSRMDSGTRLSRQAVLDGLRRAVADGYLEVEASGDNGRRRHAYRLRMAEDSPQSASQESRPVEEGTSLNSRPGPVYDLDRTSLNSRPRTEKETLERNSEKTLSDPSGPDGECAGAAEDRSKEDNGRNGASRPSAPEAWDRRAAEELRRIVATHVAVNRTARTAEWARHFRLLRTADGRPKAEIRATLEWYAGRIGQPYIPVALSGSAFRAKYLQLRAAMRREELPATNGHARTNGSEMSKLMEDIRNGRL